MSFRGEGGVRVRQVWKPMIGSEQNAGLGRGVSGRWVGRGDGRCAREKSSQAGLSMRRVGRGLNLVDGWAEKG